MHEVVEGSRYVPAVSSFRPNGRREVEILFGRTSGSFRNTFFRTFFHTSQ